MLVHLLILPFFLSPIAASLTCKCDKCDGAKFCVESTGPGDRCYAKLEHNPTLNETFLIRGCYKSASTGSCGVVTPNLVIECCSSHYCNVVIDLKLPDTNEGPMKPNIKPTDNSSPTEEPSQSKYTRLIECVACINVDLSLSRNKYHLPRIPF